MVGGGEALNERTGGAPLESKEQVVFRQSTFCPLEARSALNTVSHTLDAQHKVRRALEHVGNFREKSGLGRRHTQASH